MLQWEERQLQSPAAQSDEFGNVVMSNARIVSNSYWMRMDGNAAILAVIPAQLAVGNECIVRFGGAGLFGTVFGGDGELKSGEPVLLAQSGGGTEADLNRVQLTDDLGKFEFNGISTKENQDCVIRWGNEGEQLLRVGELKPGERREISLGSPLGSGDVSGVLRLGNGLSPGVSVNILFDGVVSKIVRVPPTGDYALDLPRGSYNLLLQSTPELRLGHLLVDALRVHYDVMLPGGVARGKLCYTGPMLDDGMPREYVSLQLVDEFGKRVVAMPFNIAEGYLFVGLAPGRYWVEAEGMEIRNGDEGRAQVVIPDVNGETSLDIEFGLRRR